VSGFGSGGPVPSGSHRSGEPASRLESWDRGPVEPGDASDYLPEVGIVLAVLGSALGAVMLLLGLALAVLGRPLDVMGAAQNIGFIVLMPLWIAAVFLQSRNRTGFFESWPFSRLRGRGLLGVLAGVAVAVILAATAASHLGDGGPIAATATCEFPLSDHGRKTCVTESEYLRVGSAEQQLGAAAIGGFAIIAAAAGLVQLRRE